MVHSARRGCAHSPWDGVQGWDGLRWIVGMGGQGAGHQQAMVRCHGGLAMVMWVTAIVVTVFHEA